MSRAYIEVNGRRYTVKLVTVGVNFGTEARVRIGGATFDSGTVPLGFNAAARTRLLNAVQVRYPAATEGAE